MLRRIDFDNVEHPDYTTVVIAAWSVGLAAYVVGDTSSTIVALQLGAYEAAPVASAFLDALGYWGLIVNKALVVFACVLLWKYYPDPFNVNRDPYRLIIPLVMIPRGIWLLTNNVKVILELL